MIALVGAVALIVLAYSVQQILSLSSSRTRLRGQMSQDEAPAGRANTEAAALQHSINARALKGVALNAQQANKLIDERTFSWTAFFGLVGKALPDDVRIDSVAPSIDKDGVVVLMTVVSKKPDD